MTKKFLSYQAPSSLEVDVLNIPVICASVTGSEINEAPYDEYDGGEL